jgi:GABA permease
VWHRFEVVDRARAEYSNLPVTHVVATPVATAAAVRNGYPAG